ncbi:MAG: RNA polymerase sigma factor [Bacteroidetes bacterium]|nr:RNA polymerase sigma factor [Bacteroidota bacterium]
MKYGAATDNALMEAIGRNDEQAFAELYGRYGRRMYRFFYRMLWQDAARAEDFTQELFIKIIERPEAYNVSRPFVTWLYTLAHNLCKNEYRRQVRSLARQNGAQTEVAPAYQPENPDQELLEQQLRAALDALPEAQRQCFILRYQEELSVQAIADIVGCPEGTVKSRLHHAIQKLAADMQHIWGPSNTQELYKNLVIKYL